ncbi:MAG: hypothetical protein VYC06_01310, partial [Thermoproteota archaeon]|nr:hypothetical protein [Thermoproteota archaeon]
QGAIVIDVAISRHNVKLDDDTDYDDIIQSSSCDKHVHVLFVHMKIDIILWVSMSLPIGK